MRKKLKNKTSNKDSNQNNLKNTIIKAAKIYLFYKTIQILGFIILMIIIMRSRMRNKSKK